MRENFTTTFSQESDMDVPSDTGKRSEGLLLPSTKNHCHHLEKVRQTAFVYTAWRHLVTW